MPPPGASAAEVAESPAGPGSSYDLGCLFHCSRDMGDPLAAAAHIRRRLAHDGTLLLVEPMAGEARLTELLTDAGFTIVRRGDAVQPRPRGADLSRTAVIGTLQAAACGPPPPGDTHQERRPSVEEGGVDNGRTAQR